MAHPPRIPVWLPSDQAVVYFVTFCVENRKAVLATPAIFDAFQSAISRLERWQVMAAVVMPDHVHLLAAPTQDREEPVGNLSGALKRWTRQNCRPGASPGVPIKHGKRGACPTTDICRTDAPDWKWQSGSFDRLLRSDESAEEKWEYMRANPVRAGLVERWEAWPYFIGFQL